MKKINAIAIVMMFMTVFVAAAATADDSICDSVDMEWIRTHVPVPPAKIIEKAPLNGLCQVILDIQGQLVPVFTGKNFVLAGEMFQDKQQMTQNKINDLKTAAIKESMDKLKTVVSMSYAPANANGKVVYMLTDPLCPYCSQAGDQLKDIADETGATFKLILANVHGEAGEKKVKEALCKNFTFDQYIASEWKQTPPEEFECEKADTFWVESSKVVSGLGVRGLPAFITMDGQMVSGANMPAVKEAIGKMTSKTDDGKKVVSEAACDGQCDGQCQNQCKGSCDKPCAKKQG